jgi:tetratricopeptide (TPR) repeat protein
MTQKKKGAEASANPKTPDNSPEAAKTRLAGTGRNDECPCGSGKKYKKCHLQADEGIASPPAGPPDPQEMIDNGWRLFEQRRPGAAEKEFRKALELKAGSTDALVGIGMAKLQTGDNDGARKELSEVIKLSEPLAAELSKQGVKDAFTRKEAQAYIRASHALGCLCYDTEKYDEALAALERVYSVDEGTVGIEARLIAAKTLVKLKRPADAVPVLEPVAKNAEAGSRAQLGLALAHFSTGDRAKAQGELNKALAANQYFGKAILGQIRKRVDNPIGAAPGSREEALIYAQTYGDVWDEPAKKFLEEALEGAQPSSETAEAPAPAAP